MRKKKFNSIKTPVWREAIQPTLSVLQSRSTLKAPHLDQWHVNWWAPKNILWEFKKKPRGSLEPVMICCVQWLTKWWICLGHPTPDESWYFGIASLRGRPIYNSDLDLDCLAANGWQTTVIIGVIASCKGVFLFFCVGLKSWQHNSITYLHFKWSAHLHFPFTFSSKTNYFLFIMKGLGSAVVTIFCPEVYLRGYRSIRREDTCIRSI